MEVSVQLHAAAALLLGNDFPVPIGYINKRMMMLNLRAPKELLIYQNAQE